MDPDGSITTPTTMDATMTDIESTAGASSSASVSRATTSSEPMLTGDGEENAVSSTIPNPGLYDNATASGSTQATERKKRKANISNLMKELMKYKNLRHQHKHITTNLQNARARVTNKLEPGADKLFRVLVLKHGTFLDPRPNMRNVPMISQKVKMVGTQTLDQLRDVILCANDFGPRIDVSEMLNDPVPPPSAKVQFPSGFFLINNVFYVDDRPGCKDMSAPLRAWAAETGVGEFQRRSMCETQLQDVELEVGNVELYQHQGDCKHWFIFSEVRPLEHTDKLSRSFYPNVTGDLIRKQMYCKTCSKFKAIWICVDSERLPYDPCYLCDKCRKRFLYDKNGRKKSNFKLYHFRCVY